MLEKLIADARRRGYTVRTWRDECDDGTGTSILRISGKASLVGTGFPDTMTEQERIDSFADLLRASDIGCPLP